MGNERLEKFIKRWDREIPDDRRVYGIKLCMAGAESKKVRDGLNRIGVQCILVSYFYLRNWLKNRSHQEVAEDFGRFDFTILDSGGFTLIQQLLAGESKLNIQEYAEEYYGVLRKFGDIFSGCAEVDTPKELGLEYSEDMRSRLFGEGIPIMPVIQPHMPVDHYVSLGWFDTYPFIAIGSAALEDKHRGYIVDVYRVAKDRGVLLHGFGATSSEVMLKSQFYSSDSTTWLNGSKFGSTMVFENGRIRHYDNKQKDVRKRFRKRFENCGIVWKDIEAEKGFEVDMMNALAWKQLSDYVRFSAQRAYWLTADERDRALSLKSKAFNTEGLIDRKTSLARADARRMVRVDNADYDDRAHEVLHCDSCAQSGRCPRYKPSEPCGYDINVRLETKADLQKMLTVLLELQYGRVMTAALFEKIEGGVLDKNLSTEMQRTLTMVADLREIFGPVSGGEELEIKAKGGAPGSVASMLASVFAPTGNGGSGSGNTRVEREANKLINVTPED